MLLPMQSSRHFVQSIYYNKVQPNLYSKIRKCRLVTINDLLYITVTIGNFVNSLDIYIADYILTLVIESCGQSVKYKKL